MKIRTKKLPHEKVMALPRPKHMNPLRPPMILRALYNCLQIRRVKDSADVKRLLTPEEIEEKTIAELDAIIDESFAFNQFA